MKQAIPGVSPPELGETTMMTVWPSIAATGLGRLVGRACGAKPGFGKFFTLGKLLALPMIPVALAAYFWKLRPWGVERYRLTNRRLAVERGISFAEVRSIALDGFDSIEILVRSGQEWYPAGDLVFRHGPVEVFRLAGVHRPEGFRRVCLKAHDAYVSIRAVLASAAPVPA